MGLLTYLVSQKLVHGNVVKSSVVGHMSLQFTEIVEQTLQAGRRIKGTKSLTSYFERYYLLLGEGEKAFQILTSFSQGTYFLTSVQPSPEAIGWVQVQPVFQATDSPFPSCSLKTILYLDNG